MHRSSTANTSVYSRSSTTAGSEHDKLITGLQSAGVEQQLVMHSSSRAATFLLAQCNRQVLYRSNAEAL
jgi:hypothetical protein